VVLFPTGVFMPPYPTLLWCGVDLVGQALVMYRHYKAKALKSLPWSGIRDDLNTYCCEGSPDCR
jgi:hypothetical protein